MPESKPPHEPLSKEQLIAEATQIRQKLQELLSEVKGLIAQTKKLADDMGERSKPPRADK